MATDLSWAQVGGRVREARLAAGKSQQQLADDLNLDRSALVRIEGGQRQVTALELYRVGDVLGLPVSHFLSESPTAITSRRAELTEDAGQVDLDRYTFDAILESHARDAHFLRDLGHLGSASVELAIPEGITTPEAASRFAREARAAIDRPTGPLADMAEICEALGLYVLAVQRNGDGASLRIDDSFGVAVIGSSGDPGRRRTTAAHELGHHLLGDEYQSDIGVAASRDSRESLINVFAAEFLLPGADLTASHQTPTRAPREWLIQVSGEYRVSWTLALNTARRLQLVNESQARDLRDQTPQRGDFMAVCGAEPRPDLTPGSTGPEWRIATLSAYTSGQITSARAIELLHGALDQEDLPDRPVEPTP